MRTVGGDEFAINQGRVTDRGRLIGVRHSRFCFAVGLVALGTTVAALLLEVTGADAASQGLLSGWTRADLRPVSQPAAVSGRFVLYVAAGGGLEVVGLDARSGRTLWSRSASSSANAPGQPPALVVSGSTVVYLRPVSGEEAELAAVDAATGREVWRSRRADFTSWPSVCPDAADTVCVTGAGAALRFGLQTGELLQAVAFAPTAAGREIGPGLFDPAKRNPEMMEGAPGAVIAWHEPLGRVFTLRGASTDWGWNFDRYNRLGLFVGSPGWKPAKQIENTATIDLSHAMTAGFRIANGAPVWRNVGSTYVCGYLPCPGGINPSVSRPMDRLKEPTTGIRVRATGTLSGSLSASRPPLAAANAQATLEGFQLATGKTTWSFHVGHDVGLIQETLLPPQTGLTSIALLAADGHYVELNLSTGVHHRMSQNTVGWCRRATMYKQSVAYHAGNGKTITTYIGQDGIGPCSATGARVRAPASVPSFLGQTGAEINGLIAWSDVIGVSAEPATQ